MIIAKVLLSHVFSKLLMVFGPRKVAYIYTQ
ncbi:hypothetical protein XTPLMG730_1358 [Xanthomonas translucens pv. phlei]|uniref:Uncharacterized protein n=1 Tax=Xanthomonas graminis pv. phlei TaxID=487906 RepID=A0A0K2ZRX0_9XANT|nr:hypothetical protein XTPLMG730_1358 [Xanthomonas translucens pv. phlei]